MPATGEEHSEGGYLTCGFFSSTTHYNVDLTIVTPEFFHGLDTAPGYITHAFAAYPADQRSSPSGLAHSAEYWLPAGPGKFGVALIGWTHGTDALTLMVSSAGLTRSALEDAARTIDASIP